MRPFITVIQCTAEIARSPRFLAEQAYCKALCDQYEDLDDVAFYPWEADMTAYAALFGRNPARDLSDALLAHCEGREYQEALEEWLEESRRYDAAMNE